MNAILPQLLVPCAGSKAHSRRELPAPGSSRGETSPCCSFKRQRRQASEMEQLREKKFSRPFLKPKLRTETKSPPGDLQAAGFCRCSWVGARVQAWLGQLAVHRGPPADTAKQP